MSKLKMYYRWITNYMLARSSCLGTYALPPRVLSIETTELCNLDCIMCPRKQSGFSGREFTLKQFKHVLSLFPSINTVILLGRGETFMMRDIFPVLNFGSSKGIHFTIVTNGTMFTPETIRKIPNTGKVLVSIDHPRADGYGEIRRGGDLNSVVANLKALRKSKPNQWICIQSLIMKNNLDFLEDFIKLAEDVSADAVKLIHPIIFDQADRDIYVGYSDDVKSRLFKAQACARRAGVRFVAVPGMNRPRVCVEPWLELRVSLSGDVYPCCYIYNSSGSSWCEWYDDVALKVPQSNYVMGNVYSNSANDIWNGEGFRSLRRMIINTKSNVLLPGDRLNALRSTINTSQRFSYCSTCLYRQNRAC